MTLASDPVKLTQELIKCPSVTPEEGGALELLEALLTPIGFKCTRIDLNGISNLYARYGSMAPVFCFGGHTDVVPLGNRGDWQHDPFGAEISEGNIWGRGAVDMKSGVACFAVAAAEFIKETPDFPGSISMLITGDEEGDAVYGTDAVLDWMKDNGETIDHCIVGEPTCPDQIGDMMKIGRRGSMTAYFTANGKQGHSAYPHRAANPLHPLMKLLDQLANWHMDSGTDHFDASTLSVTTVDVGNTANNVIPASAKATVNIRFNDAHTSAKIKSHIEQLTDACFEEKGVSCDIDYKVSGESFITEPGYLSDLVTRSVQNCTGRKPILSTTGGTSDARFIKKYAPVVEFGLVGRSMHQTDEYVSVDDIAVLTKIYGAILRRYFGDDHGNKVAG